MKEKAKMSAGLWYDANDAQLMRERGQAKHLCHLLNHQDPDDEAALAKLWKQLLPHRQNNVIILTPFLTDYGYHCFIDTDTFINHGAYFMDGAPITIGKRCQIGPECGLYTATHPLQSDQRSQGWEQALPIHIADDVWIGARVTVLAGVSIGQGSVIGAGSVVTKDIPPMTLAYGNPCRIIRLIDEATPHAKQLPHLK